MSIKLYTKIYHHHFDRIKNAEAMWVFTQLSSLVQNHSFIGSREDAIKAIHAKHPEMHIDTIKKEIDYLYTVDVGMEDMIKE